MQSFTGVVLDRFGNAVENAEVLVLDEDLALPTLYEDDGITPKTNPTTTDNNGTYTFRIEDGIYTRRITGKGLPQRILPAVTIAEPTPRANALRNGAFQLWRRGTSKTVNAGAAGYVVDGWLMTPGSSGSMTASQQAFTLGQTEVPGNPRFFMRLNTNAAQDPDFEQRIEGVRQFSGRKVTLSFYARAGAAVQLANGGFIVQNFGTGGAPSATVYTPIGVIDLTTSWQRFRKTISVPSVNGKTLGSNGDDFLAVAFAPTDGGTEQIDIANVKLEPGALATPFEIRPITEELARCNRYYQSSFHLEVASPIDGEGVNYFDAVVVNTNAVHAIVRFSDHMRAQPTMTFLRSNLGVANGKWQFWDGAAWVDATTANWYANTRGFVARLTDITATAGAAAQVAGGWIADAEL